MFVCLIIDQCMLACTQVADIVNPSTRQPLSALVLNLQHHAPAANNSIASTTDGAPELVSSAVGWDNI